MHAERHVGLMPAAAALERDESVARLRLLLLVLLQFLLPLLQLLLQLRNGGPVQAMIGDTTMFEGATLVTRTVVIVPLTDDLAAAHYDTTVAVVERGPRSLLEAKRQVVVGLHVAVAFVGGLGRLGLSGVV